MLHYMLMDFLYSYASLISLTLLESQRIASCASLGGSLLLIASAINEGTETSSSIHALKLHGNFATRPLPPAP